MYTKVKYISFPTLVSSGSQKNDTLLLTFNQSNEFYFIGCILNTGDFQSEKLKLDLLSLN